MDGDIATLRKQQTGADVLWLEQRHTGAGFRRAPAFGGNASGPGLPQRLLQEGHIFGHGDIQDAGALQNRHVGKVVRRVQKKIVAQQFEILDDRIGIPFCMIAALRPELW